tara:strand:- start:860 stop:1186 length:327 start_codon:yes stop_codon:yes gene_type:complete
MNGPENRQIRESNLSIYPLEPKFFNVRGPKPLEFSFRGGVKVFSSSFRVWGSPNDTPARNEGGNTATIERLRTFFFIFGEVVLEPDTVTMECSIVIDWTLEGGTPSLL